MFARSPKDTITAPAGESQDQGSSTFLAKYLLDRLPFPDEESCLIWSHRDHRTTVSETSKYMSGGHKTH